MRITKFKLTNHKSILDSGELFFEPGINIIAGKNNSGKTAILEALSLRFDNKPHRSTITLPTPTSVFNQTTNIEFEFEVAGPTVRDWALTRTQQMGLPISNQFGFPYNEQGFSMYFESLCNNPYLKFRMAADINGSAWSWNRKFKPALVIPEPRMTDYGNQYVQALFRGKLDGSGFIYENGAQSQTPDTEFSHHCVAENFRRRVYRFTAERMNIAAHPHGPSTILSSGASNLPEVLNNLTQKRNAYGEYLTLVKQIFPEIHHIGIRVPNSGQVEIIVHFDGSERDDLAIRLTECGTGLSQVLSILYVAFNEKLPHVIIIDEPNSFLHPGATKMLMGILSSFDQHQYIVSSHSGEVFKSPNVSTLKLVTLNKGISSIKSLSWQEIEKTKECLLELGIEISDFLSSDTTVWVEGPTEKHCFPLILRSIKEWKDFSASFMPVRSTNEFEGKHVDLALDIHRKMTDGNLVLPKKTVFIFDPELRTDQQKQDLAKRNISFLPRRMYENYLVDSEAIAALLNTFECYAITKLEKEQVDQWLSENGSRFLPNKKTQFDIANEKHLEKLDGATLLKDLFQHFTQTTHSYDKIRHGKHLTDWLLSKRANHFKDLAQFIHDRIVN